MVFSSIQAYLDSSNWQQPPPSSYQNTGMASGAHLLTPPPQLPPHPPQPPSHGSGSGSIRPGSMADRARLANIPMPDASLKCPRCESTNTKFCYFNNYSLTQPRHFCKTCRRYWTRGGALRNVPVGGGCRRNKRSKSNGNNSGNTSNTTTTNSGSSSTNMIAAVGPTSAIGSILSSSYGGSHHESILSQVLSPAVRLMSPTFNHLNESPPTDNAAAATTSIGLLNYGTDLSSIQIAGAGGSLLSSLDQWKPSQPPQLLALGGGNLDSSRFSGFYPFEAGNVEQSGLSNISSSISSALMTQLASVKVEDNPYKCLSWMDLSSFGSSSAGNPL